MSFWAPPQTPFPPPAHGKVGIIPVPHYFPLLFTKNLIFPIPLCFLPLFFNPVYAFPLKPFDSGVLFPPSLWVLWHYLFLIRTFSFFSLSPFFHAKNFGYESFCPSGLPFPPQQFSIMHPRTLYNMFILVLTPPSFSVSSSRAGGFCPLISPPPGFFLHLNGVSLLHTSAFLDVP